MRLWCIYVYNLMTCALFQIALKLTNHGLRVFPNMLEAEDSKSVQKPVIAQQAVFRGIK